MKNIYKVFILVAILTAGSSFANAQTIESENAALSKCKSNGLGYFYKPASDNYSYGLEITDYGDYDESKGPAYRLEYNDGVLTVSWYNHLDNCALPFEGISLKQDGDTFIFDIDIDIYAPVADCICIYDLKASFPDVAPGHYKVSFDRGYSYQHIDLEDSSDNIIYEKGMIPTGINDINSGNKCMLNKIGNLLTVVTDSSARVEIYDSNGVKVIDLIADAGDTIDIAHLNKGLYSAKISNSKSSSTIKFIL